uniref:PMIS2 transmembrane protein n=1 Tax=Rousettus aegyptiacus TaxID=9407 RepID=A0A7J8CKF2_ROUAE|nr:PMIS2 transmembrane protein [Rousettus aegyptiacus]
MPPKQAAEGTTAAEGNPAAPAAEKDPAAATTESKEQEDPIQTPEELAFHAPIYLGLTILAVIIFPPLGAPAAFFCYKTWRANKKSEWEQAYVNSSRTGWLDVLAILIGLGIIYYYILFA